MLSKVFQSVISQMQGATDRNIGVIDNNGIVVAAIDLSLVGSKTDAVPELSKNNDDITIFYDGNTYKPLGKGTPNEYYVFTEGEDDLSKTVCIMASVAITEAGIYFEENHDRHSFVKKIISENILLGDITARANELRIEQDITRGVLVVRVNKTTYDVALELIKTLFPEKQNDFVISIGSTDIVIVKEMPAGSDTEYLTDLAATISEKLEKVHSLSSVIGVSLPAGNLLELSGRYKQALVAIDIGRVFEIDKTIISYENLGISRLIYQLPTTLCEIFLQEVFKRNPIEVLDQETLYTIDCFFENSLNVSEAARKLFIHRNTLVYRLDRIQKITGLDLREFDHAIVFKVALMVKKYLTSQQTSANAALK